MPLKITIGKYYVHFQPSNVAFINNCYKMYNKNKRLNTREYNILTLDPTEMILRQSLFKRKSYSKEGNYFLWELLLWKWRQGPLPLSSLSLILSICNILYYVSCLPLQMFASTTSTKELYFLKMRAKLLFGALN